MTKTFGRKAASHKHTHKRSHKHLHAQRFPYKNLPKAASNMTSIMAVHGNSYTIEF